MTKKRYIINFTIIFLLAVISGLFLGKMFIPEQGPTLSSESEASVKGNELKLAKAKAKGKSPAELNAVENFMVAEDVLNNCTSVKKITTGTITATVSVISVNQSLFSQKIVHNGEVYSDKISASSFVEVAEAQRYKIGSDKVDIYSGKVKSSNSAEWSKTPSESFTYERYKYINGSGPERMISYVVCSRTVITQTEMKKNSNGNYTATITLNNVEAVMNYIFEIRATSDPKTSKSENPEDRYKLLPKFESVEITFEIDSNWKFLNYQINEVYDAYAVGGYQDCKAKINNEFVYEGVEIPAI